MLFKKKEKIDNFKDCLSFLLEYGFIYSENRYNDKRPCYYNKHGEIAFHYIRLDYYMDCPEIYVSINGWKKVINPCEEYRKIFHRKIKNIYLALNKIADYKVSMNSDFFEIKIDYNNNEN